MGVVYIFTVPGDQSVCTPALAASIAAWAIACIIVSCSFAILDFFCICLKVAFVGLPYLSLPIFDCLYGALLSALLRLLLLTPCSIPCLIKHNTGLCLCTYLLLCVYQNQYYNMYTCLYIQRWCSLADYTHDAYCLCYLH